MDAGIRERLDEFIRRKGLRRTTQRDAVISSAFSKDEHFTAEELYERVRKKHPDVSRATVYRTLLLLVEADLLRAIDLGENQTTYDPNFHDKPSHNHLLCIDCGRVVEFEDAHIDLLNDCVTRRLGFKPASTLQDALEMASDVVGRDATITHLHNPPILMADVS